MFCNLSWKYNEGGKEVKKNPSVRANVDVDENRTAIALRNQILFKKMKVFNIIIAAEVIILKGVEEKRNKYDGFYQEWFLTNINSSIDKEGKK